MDGHLILVTAPTGSGKGVLIQHLKDLYAYDAVFPVTCTTRDMRPGEVDGVSYYFLSPQEFQNKIDDDEFLEWVEIDGGKRYGSLKSEIIDPLTQGKIVIRELEIQGVQVIKKLIPVENVTVVGIDAGSWELLKSRIISRAPLSEKEILFRKERYESEYKFLEEVDFIIKNTGSVEQAKEEIEAIVRDIIKNTQNKNTNIG